MNIVTPQRVHKCADGGIWTSPSPIHYEIKDLNTFDVIINVSDSPMLSLGLHSNKTKPGVIHFWFPIQEACQWNLGTLDAICRVLDQYVDRQWLKVLVHCSGGVCRAPTCASLWKTTRHIGATYESVAGDHDISIALRRGQIEELDIKVLIARGLGHYFSTDGLAIDIDKKAAVKRFRLKERKTLGQRFLKFFNPFICLIGRKL